MILLRVFVFFLLMLFIPDWYICRTFFRRSKRAWLKPVFWLPSVSLLFALAVIVGGGFNDVLGLYIIIALCISTPKAIFSFVYWLFHRKPKVAWPLSVVLSLCVLGYLIFGATEGKHWYHVKEVVFYSSQLPDAFDGYRILQISDIHSGSWNNDTIEMARAVDLCNAQQADMIVFTGDLVNNLATETIPYASALSKLRTKDGVYSVLGNHDYAMYVKWDTKAEQIADIEDLIVRERKMGWDVLMNENRIIHRGSDSIALVGVENSGNPPFPNRGKLLKAQQGTDGMFKVLLSHDPTHWRRNVLPETDIQLMLAGHTHDMQFSIFGFSPSVFIYPEHRGLYLENERGLYVNIGLGYVLFPMRLGAWPEITVITLKKKK